jgi:methylated-DNA-protein-cysteine methyltransferase-like protein
MPRPGQAQFYTAVYALVRQVPPGHVTTYGSIASALGMPHWARQVGWAMAALRDSDDDDVPAHRVVNAEGGVRGGWSAAVRRALLEDEGVEFDADGHVRLTKHLWEPETVVDDTAAKLDPNTSRQ